MSVPTITELAERILTHYQTVLAANSRPIPARSYVSSGDIVIDEGDQLTVNFKFLTPGTPGVPVIARNKCDNFQYATFEVGLVRCSFPTIGNRGEVPSAAVIDAAGRSYLADVEAMLAATDSADLAVMEDYRDFMTAYSDISTVGPDGSFIGVVVTLLVPVFVTGEE